MKVNIYTPVGAQQGNNCTSLIVVGLWILMIICSPRSCILPRRRRVKSIAYTNDFHSFFSHSSGFTFGNPRSWPFDHWIQQSPNVVIVSVYYRLSSFGFMTVPEFSNPLLGDFNAGLQDQIQALRWIKQYISRFGGNPNQVTINGQSAGGSSVQLHLLFTGVRENLFHQAIAQSAPRRPVPTPEQQRVFISMRTTSIS